MSDWPENARTCIHGSLYPAPCSDCPDGTTDPDYALYEPCRDDRHIWSEEESDWCNCLTQSRSGNLAADLRAMPPPAIPSWSRREDER